MTDPFEAELRDALALTDDELGYASTLNLAAPWRVQPAVETPLWGGLALTILVAGYLAWLAISPFVAPVVGPVTEVGLGTLPIYTALARLANVGLAVVNIARQPTLWLTAPVLALVALALLLWPRQLNPQRSAI